MANGGIEKNNADRLVTLVTKLVNQEHALPGSCLKENREPGGDKFRSVYPGVDWEIQLDYAQQLGLGSKEYEIKKI